MPELPEVEVLVRHLKPLLLGKSIRAVTVLRPKILLPTSVDEFLTRLRGATFVDLIRRGKYLVFELQGRAGSNPFKLLGHLGMTGRMYLSDKARPLPKHVPVLLDLGRENFVFEDTRYFGKLTLNTIPLERLGPEPLGPAFHLNHFARALARSRQAIKVKLLDQTVVAGVGNIYANEVLFQAGISPRLPACRLNLQQIRKLRVAIRRVLAAATRLGSTVPLNYGGGSGDRLFYFGRAADLPDFYEERLLVYDRANQPCCRCGSKIRRIVQAARSTFFCPKCQSRQSLSK